MKKIVERIVKSEGAPLETDIWLKPSTGELKHFENGEWKLISGGSGSSEGGSSEGGSSQGGDSSSAIQIVELNFDGSIPKTGTMSADDIAKLEGDDCFLVINGKYYYKSFESDSGIDYNEFKLTTVLGGIRTTYFTVNKSTGAYTINYVYPVEANLETSGTLPELENIKVGNTTYAIPSCGGTMIVRGSLNGNEDFVPVNGEPTWSEAATLFENGGTITLAIQDGEYLMLSRIVARYPQRNQNAAALQFMLEGSDYYWADPS